MELRALAFFLFPAIAGAAVWWAGRRDIASDLRLTTAALACMAAYPLLWLLPALPILPRQWAETLPATSSAIGGVPLWLSALAVLWLAGFLLALLRLLRGFLGLKSWHRGSQAAGWAGDPADHIELRILPGLRGPVASGCLRRSIYLPESWPAWPDETRAAVLAHECAHHRRLDPLRRWLAEFACAVYWFHPVAAWLKRRLFLQCELACDLQAIRETLPPARYAGMLLDISTGRAPAGACAMASPSTLEIRVRRLLAPAGPDTPAAPLVLLAAAILASALLLGAAGVAGVPSAAGDEPETRRGANPFPADP
jgi:beta-lactamase regulating signal transducer with metallopeptidase domain